MDVEKLILEEIEIMKKIEEAKKKAEEIKAEAQKEVRKILDEVALEDRLKKYIEEQDKKIQTEAQQIIENYKKMASELKNIPDAKIREVAKIILKEVLPIE